MFLGPFSDGDPPVKLLENKTKNVPPPTSVGLETEGNQKTGFQGRV